MPYAQLEDIKLFYKILGDLQNDRPTLVFLHGGPGIGDHSIYLSYWSIFSKQLNVIFIDQRACGRSEKGDPAKWRLTQHGKDVHSFCEVLGIKKPIVAGVSWGGYVALCYAAQYPAHPKALILCNTEAKVSPEERYQAFQRIAGQQAANAVKEFDAQWNVTTNANYFKYCLPFFAKNAYKPEELAKCIRNPDFWEKFMTKEHTKFDLTPELKKYVALSFI